MFLSWLNYKSFKLGLWLILGQVKTIRVQKHIKNFWWCLFLKIKFGFCCIFSITLRNSVIFGKGLGFDLDQNKLEMYFSFFQF